MMGKTNSVTRRALTFDATATADSLLYGHTAYGADGTKLTGAGAYWPLVRTLAGVFYQSQSPLPDSVSLYCPLVTGMRQAFRNATGVKSLTLTTGILTDMHSAFSGCASLETLVNSLDLSSVIEVNLFGVFSSCPSLKDVLFAFSCIKGNFSFLNSPLLSTTSLLSIANGLNAGTPATLTMHETSKTNMDNINVDVVDGVAILGTTKTLTQFITTDKGWTIA